MEKNTNTGQEALGKFGNLPSEMTFDETLADLRNKLTPFVNLPPMILQLNDPEELGFERWITLKGLVNTTSEDCMRLYPVIKELLTKLESFAPAAMLEERVSCADELPDEGEYVTDLGLAQILYDTYDQTQNKQVPTWYRLKYAGSRMEETVVIEPKWWLRKYKNIVDNGTN